MTGRIAARPDELRAEAQRLRAAGEELRVIGIGIKGQAGGVPMPANAAAHASVELNAVSSLLLQLSDGFHHEEQNISNRARWFELAGKGGAFLILLKRLDDAVDPFLDPAQRIFRHPRYYRFGTWVRKYSYTNKYGTTVNVSRSWRNLANKRMKEGNVFRGIGEDSKVLKGLRFAGKASTVFAFAWTGYEQWSADAATHQYSTGEEVVRSGIAAGAVTGGAWAGAEGGAVVGATIGSVFPGPGTVVGGVIGAGVGALAGSFAADKLTHALLHKFW